MLPIRQYLPLYVKPNAVSGRGVFCEAPIEAEVLLEIAPVIVLPAEDQPHIHATELYNYYFIWGHDDQQIGIVLGYGSMYNHSTNPNVEYHPHYDTQTLHFYSLKPIPAHTELVVNYNGTPSVQDAVWFEEKRKKADD